MRTILRAIKWLFLLGPLAAGVAGYFWWQRGDDLLRQQILLEIAEIAPEWDVRVGKARFDWNRHVRLFDVDVRPADATEEFLTVPEVVVHVDRELLTSRQTVLIQKIKLHGLVVNVARSSNGQWSWEDLPPLQLKQTGSPELEIVDGTLRVRCEHAHAAAATQLNATRLQMQVVPSGRRRYVVKANTEVDQAGTLTAEGRVDLDNKTWQMTGRLSDVQVGPELMQLAAGLSDDVRAKLTETAGKLSIIAQRLTEESVPSRGSPFQLAAEHDDGPRTTAMAAARRISDTTPVELPLSLGISGVCDLNFELSRDDAIADPEFRFWGELQQGKIENDVLPFPLHDVRAKYVWDNDRLWLYDAVAKNGVTRLELSAGIDRGTASAVPRVTAAVTSLPIDARLRSRLSPSLRRLFDEVNPTGIVDVEAKLSGDGSGGWNRESFVMHARDATVLHFKFPYSIRGVRGTVEQRGDGFALQFQGLAGQHPVQLSGLIRGSHPEAESQFHIEAEGLTLDERFLAACPEEVRKVLRALRLQGTVHVDQLSVFRAPGSDATKHWNLQARLVDGTLEYQHFPYRLQRFSGQVTYNSRQSIWVFRELNAEHDGAQLQGHGSFSLKPEPGQLDLLISAQHARFDRDLQRALPPSLQELWDDLQPSGRFNALTSIKWMPGQPVHVTLPDVQLTDARLMPRAFPYALERIQSRLNYTDGAARITSFQAVHESTTLAAHGVVEHTPEGTWRLKLEELIARDLLIDQAFRRAVPEGLRAAVESLHPRSPVTVSGRLELGSTGQTGAPVWSQWDLAIDAKDMTLSAGVELKKIDGRVTAAGRYDGRRLTNDGRLELNRLSVLDHEIKNVRGPYHVNDHLLTLGNGQALRADADYTRLDLASRITGDAIDGKLTCDAVIALRDAPEYHALVTLSKGRLEQYAQQYLHGVRNVSGEMNGSVRLRGRGSSPDGIAGEGKLQMSPAALYELPVMVQLFNLLTFIPPDKTAFKYALFDFTIARRQFQFKSIDLIGDGLRLRGLGTTGFDGGVNLQFYSMLPPRNQLPIPLVKNILNEATKGWIGVKVTGTVDAPQAEFIPVPTLDLALKGFLSVLETPARVPWLLPPLLPQRSTVRQPQPDRR